MSALGRASRRQVAVAVLLAVATGAGVAVNSAVGGLIGLGVVCVIALWVLATRLAGEAGGPEGTARLVRWTMWAFAGHLVLSVALNAVLFSSSDARVYHRDAVGLLRHWAGGFPAPALPNGKEGYYYLLAGLFWLFGVHNLAGLLVNAAFAAALVPLVSDLTRRLVGDEPARYVPWLVVLLPGLLLWTSQLLKEAAIVFLVALCLNAAVRLLDRISFWRLAALATGLALLFTMRSYVGLVVAMGLLGGIVLGRPSVLGGLGVGVSAAAVMAVLVTATGVGYSGYKAATSSNLKQANVVRKDLATSANSGFGSDIDISTPSAALSSLPAAASTFLFGPLPWRLSGGRQVVALPDVFTWWLLLPSLWRGLRLAMRRIGRGVLILVLPALMTTALLSLVVANFGTVVRERTQVEVMLVPLLALGLAERRGRAAAPPSPSGGVESRPAKRGRPVGV